jgi:hypothetical protein
MFLRYTTAKKAMQLEDSMWCLMTTKIATFCQAPLRCDCPSSLTLFDPIVADGTHSGTLSLCSCSRDCEGRPFCNCGVGTTPRPHVESCEASSAVHERHRPSPTISAKLHPAVSYSATGVYLSYSLIPHLQFQPHDEGAQVDKGCSAPTLRMRSLCNASRYNRSEIDARNRTSCTESTL